MTKKHFISAANKYGAAFRNADMVTRDAIDKFGDNKATRNDESSRLYWLQEGQLVFEEVAREMNPNFDVTRFREWIREIRQGERDLNGKKVARVAVV